MECKNKYIPRSRVPRSSLDRFQVAARGGCKKTDTSFVGKKCVVRAANMRTSFTLLTAFLALISALPNPQVSSSSASISETSSTQASSTATSSHSASSESQSPPTSTGTPDENKKSATDDFLLYGEGGFSAGLVEDKWSKTCDDPAVKNFKEHPDKSWADLGCDEMHNALIYEWWMHRNETDLPYFEYRDPEY